MKLFLIILSLPCLIAAKNPDPDPYKPGRGCSDTHCVGDRVGVATCDENVLVFDPDDECF